jgi:hypothetical protein
MWRITLAREFAVGRAFSGDLANSKCEALSVIHILAVIETK